MDNITQRLSLDLERNEELAKLVADLEPGATLDAKLSIVSKNDKTLTVELEEVSEGSASKDDDEDEEADMGEDMGEEHDTPAMKVARGNK